MGAYNLLPKYNSSSPSHQHARCKRHVHENKEVGGLMFLQNAVPMSGTDGVMHDQIKCYNCNTFGHYASVCPQGNHEQDGVQMLQVAPENPFEEDEEPYQSNRTS
jgi:hypothetical protein